MQSLVKTLRDEGDLVVIDAPVDPNLEIAEVHRRVIAAGGPALLFTNPVGYDFPVATNLFGTPSRVERCFGSRPIDFVRRAVQLTHDLMPPTLGKLWSNRDFFMEGMKVGLRPVASGPVTEVIQSPGNLDSIPMLKSWPEDGGDFVTLPLVYTENPADGSHNLGMYRVQRHSATRAGMHWQIGKGGGFHHFEAQKRGVDLPTTVFVGGPPALTLAAVAPLPENVPELLLASLLAGQRIDRAKNPVGPHPLIATCEFALVGRVTPHEVAPEGPFGDHYGYYSLQHDYPVLQIDAVCHRKDAIWPATVVGKPRQEDFYIGDYLQELLSPLFPLVMPSVKSLWSYGESGHHALASAVVEERYRREAMQAAFRVLGEGQLSLTKFLLVVGTPVDLRDIRAVLTHILERFRPETDLYVLSNVSMDTLDYSGPEVNMGSKGIMLGLGEPWRELPRSFSGDVPVGVTGVEVFCPGCLVIGGPRHSDEPDFARRIRAAFADWPMVCVVDDPSEATRTPARFLWSVFTRFEPAADIVSADQRIARHHLCYEGTVLFDSRMKDPYPRELFCDDATRRTVDERWLEYFPEGDVEMGDSDAASLDG